MPLLLFSDNGQERPITTQKEEGWPHGTDGAEVGRHVGDLRDQLESE